jgi:hypothetical protein
MVLSNENLGGSKVVSIASFLGRVFIQVSSDKNYLFHIRKYTIQSNVCKKVDSQ